MPMPRTRRFPPTTTVFSTGAGEGPPPGSNSLPKGAARRYRNGVVTDAKGWLASRFARLSTGLKMALIFSAALFPLGLIAILVSVQSADEKKADRKEETLSRLELKAQRLNSAFSRSVLTINTASVAISLTPEGSRVCATTLRQIEQGPVPV